MVDYIMNIPNEYTRPKVSPTFSIAFYFFVNMFVSGYYLPKYAPDFTPYVLFTLPYYFPTAFHNWDEIFAQTKVLYYQIYGISLPLTDYETILYALIIYALVSAVSMVVGIEYNLRKKIKD